MEIRTMHTHMKKICGDLEMKRKSFLLPDDIMMYIFLRLDTKNLAVLRCVCKSWNGLISSQSFVEFHFNQSMRNPRPLLFRCGISPSPFGFYSTKCREFENLPDPPFATELADLDVVGSCNGVLCLCSNGSDRSLIYLWNPSINKYITLPKPSNNPRYLGFGVNSTSGHLDDFKVVTIYANANAEVFSLRSNLWKKIEDGFPGSVEIINTSHINSSVFVNGSVHWCARLSCYFKNDCPWLIVSFDFTEEVFHKVKLPDDMSTVDADKYLNILDGYLCVFAAVPSPFRAYELWVMKKYGISESWTRLYRIEKPQRIWWPLGFTTRGKIFIRGECRHGGNALLIYNPHCETFKCIEVHLPHYGIQVLTFVESIIAPVPSVVVGRR